METTATDIFMRSIPQTKFPIGSDIRRTKAEMLGERIFRIVVNVTSVALLYKILLQEDCDFLHIFLGGTTDAPMYYKNYPCISKPEYLDDFYVFKLSYHLYELVYCLIFQRKRSDFPEYVLHHLITGSLIFFSYSLNMLSLGSVVMLVHDITDLTVTIFKLCIDITPVAVQLVSYLSMLVSWIYYRLWFFPGYIIYHLYWECYKDGRVCKNVNYSVLNMLLAFICGLFCLHVFWFALMVLGIFKRCKSKAGFS